MKLVSLQKREGVKAETELVSTGTIEMMVIVAKQERSIFG